MTETDDNLQKNERRIEQQEQRLTQIEREVTTVEATTHAIERQLGAFIDEFSSFRRELRDKSQTQWSPIVAGATFLLLLIGAFASGYVDDMLENEADIDTLRSQIIEHIIVSERERAVTTERARQLEKLLDEYESNQKYDHEQVKKWQQKINERVYKIEANVPQ